MTPAVVGERPVTSALPAAPLDSGRRSAMMRAVRRRTAERAPSQGGRDDPSPRPPPLPPELQFLRALWQLDHALASASRRMKAAAGVTGRERLFIRLVGRHPGITPGELADLLHVHPSSVTALLKRLQGRRLVSRRQDAEDARSIRLVLTAGGERVAALETGTIEAGVKQALARAHPRAVGAATELLTGVARRLAGTTERARRRAGR